MHIKVLACDLDGTLATDGVVAPETWTVLRGAKQAGFALVLVTGRRLETFAADGPFEEMFEAIVAENGAAVYYPRNDMVELPFGRLEPTFIRRMEALEIPLERGMAIAATWIDHDETVLKVLRETGGGATVEYNKGAVMVLPPGATKGTGLQTALHELGYSPRNVLAVGDAENDRSLFQVAELAVAVGNATPELKPLSNAVLPLGNGAAVRSMVEGLLQGRLPPHRVRPERRLLLGHRPDETLLHLSPFAVLDQNLGIAGASGSGKSWLAGLLTEELLKLGYQVCLIDPEGDYRGLRAFPHTLVLGGPEIQLPPVLDIVTLCEYTTVSLILDLSCYGIEERSSYALEVMQALTALRARRGRPHWFLLDEIHSFCPPEGGMLTDLLAGYMQEGGFGLVSFRPSCMAPVLLEAVDHWLLTRLGLQEEVDIMMGLVGRDKQTVDPAALRELPVGQAYLHLGPTTGEEAPAPGMIVFKRGRRTVPHVRHLHKYLRAPLPEAKRFYFNVNGRYKGPRVAASLWDFREALNDLPTDTLAYHLERADFERWTKNVLHDDELARRLRKIARRPGEGEDLRRALMATVVDRYEELESLI